MAVHVHQLRIGGLIPYRKPGGRVTGSLYGLHSHDSTQSAKCHPQPIAGSECRDSLAHCMTSAASGERTLSPSRCGVSAAVNPRSTPQCLGRHLFSNLQTFSIGVDDPPSEAAVPSAVSRPSIVFPAVTALPYGRSIGGHFAILPRAEHKRFRLVFLTKTPHVSGPALDTEAPMCEPLCERAPDSARLSPSREAVLLSSSVCATLESRALERGHVEATPRAPQAHTAAARRAGRRSSNHDREARR